VGCEKMMGVDEMHSRDSFT